MPAGFEIISDTGSIQVTQDYRNLLLRYSGNSAIGPSAEFHTRFRTCGPAAIAAYRFNTYPGVCPHVGHFSNGQRDASFIYWGDSSNQSFDYFIFDLLPPRGATSGLEVYNDVGQLCFSSDDYPMKVIEEVVNPYPGNSNNWIEKLIHTNNTGKTVVYAPTQSNTYYDNDGLDIEEGLFFLQCRGNQLISSEVYTLTNSASATNHIRSSPAFFRALVIDVTGYPVNYSR